MSLLVQVDVTTALISRYRRLLTKPGLRNLVTFETLLLPRVIPNEVPRSRPIRIVVRSIRRFRIPKNGATPVDRLYGRYPRLMLDPTLEVRWSRQCCSPYIAFLRRDSTRTHVSHRIDPNAPRRIHRMNDPFNLLGASYRYI